MSQYQYRTKYQTFMSLFTKANLLLALFNHAESIWLELNVTSWHDFAISNKAIPKLNQRMYHYVSELTSYPFKDILKA